MRKIIPLAAALIAFSLAASPSVAENLSPTTGFNSPLCPAIHSAHITVKRGNIVELRAKVRTGYDKISTRVTLRAADTGRVSFAFDQMQPFATDHIEDLLYIEELPLDGKREQMILRLTLSHQGCKTRTAERAFMSKPAAGPVLP